MHYHTLWKEVSGMLKTMLLLLRMILANCDKNMWTCAAEFFQEVRSILANQLIQVCSLILTITRIGTRTVFLIF